VNYTKETLAERILEIHPELNQYGCSIELDFDQEKNAWMLYIKKDDKEIRTHLEERDAAECIKGNKCIYLGVQIGQFIDYCKK